MNTLPPEIVASIADFVYEIKFITIMRLVCKNLYNGVNNSKKWRGLQQLRKLKPELQCNDDHKYLKLAYRHDIFLLYKACPEKIIYPCIYFRKACKFNSIQCVKYLKEEFRLTRNDILSGYNNALDLACMGGHLKIVEYLKEEFHLVWERHNA